MRSPPHLAPLWLALRNEAVPLSLAGGAWVGALAFWHWHTDAGPALALWPLGLGLLALGATFRGRMLGIALLAAAAGWALGAAEVARHAPFPWQQAASRSHWVVGQVAEIRAQPDEPRRKTLVLQPFTFFGLNVKNMPDELRLGVWQSQLEGVAVGGHVAAPVKILPPEAPAMPGVRDGRFWAWLGPTRLTAFTSGRLEPTADGARYLKPKPVSFFGVPARIEAWRRSIFARTQTLAQGVAAALLTGDQHGIPPHVREAYRATGLSHLLAISGMQLTLVGVGLFWLLRHLGAAVPTLALRVNLKLWAAALSLAAVGLYTLLAGASPSVVRAALMVGLVLLAVLLGRVRGVLRAWAWANIALLAVQPSLALSAGLQLSSLATLALALWALTEPKPQGILGWARGMLLATLVAGAATAPVAILNFGTQAALGVVANAVAIPLMTLATYASFAALMLWPVGAQQLALLPLGYLSEAVNAWAAWLAHLQGAPVQLGLSGVYLLSATGLLTLIFALLRAYKSLAGVTVLTVTVLLGWAHAGPQPQRIIARNAEAAWVRRPDETWQLIWAERTSNAARYARQANLNLPPVQHGAPSCCADWNLLPATGAEEFAYMQYWSTPTPAANPLLSMLSGWDIQPLRCNRVWQRVAEPCWQDSPPDKESE